MKFEKGKKVRVVRDSLHYAMTGSKIPFEATMVKPFIHTISGVTGFYCDSGLDILLSDCEEITPTLEDKPKLDPIVTSVMTQLLTRSQLGISKYSTTLKENNTDDFLQHLKEELMDAVLYIEKLQDEKV